MTQDFNINIPETLRDIKLSQWQKYIEILDKKILKDIKRYLNKFEYYYIKRFAASYLFE